MGAGHHHTTETAGQAPDFRKKLWIAFGITAGMVVVQAVGSVVTGSLALLTDT
ncbi:MAG TPA: cation transporter, partial [Enteractinococcus sp.]